jgi:hypothetical protein
MKVINGRREYTASNSKQHQPSMQRQDNDKDVLYQRICYKLDEPDPHIISIEELMDACTATRKTAFGSLGCACIHLAPATCRMHACIRPLFLLIIIYIYK